MRRPEFRDRVEAGRRLAAALAGLGLDRGADHGPVVLGLPRGGVVVAAEVARALAAPLDVMVVRKLGFPGQEELAMGAVASGGATVLNDDLVAQARLGEAALAERVAAGHREVAALEARLRDSRPALELEGRTVVVVDDGLATGATMRVAAMACRAAGASRLVVAAPVASPEAVRLLRDLADDVVCLEAPAELRAVGLHYAEFFPVDERLVRRLVWSSDE